MVQNGLYMHHCGTNHRLILRAYVHMHARGRDLETAKETPILSDAAVTGGEEG